MTAPSVLMVSPTGVSGGAERILLDLVKQASAGEYRATVLALEDGPLIEQLRSTGAPIRVANLGGLPTGQRARQAMRTVSSAIVDSRPDCVFSNTPRAHRWAALPAWRTRTPSFWHQPLVPSPVPRWDRVASLLPACCVMTLSSEALRAQLRVRPGPPVALFHPGVDLARMESGEGGAIRRRHGIPDGAPLLGMVGRLQEWKGQRSFLRAAAQVAAVVPDAHFAVVGGAIMGSEGSYPDELHRLAAELEIAGRVVFTGHTEEVPSWLSALDVMVNASEPEPFGLVMIEAMACDALVVAVNGGGPADVIDDGVTGLLCSSADHNLLAAKMIDAVVDEDLRRRITLAAKEVVHSRFSLERMAHDFGAIIRRCVNRG